MNDENLSDDDVVEGVPNALVEKIRDRAARLDHIMRTNGVAPAPHSVVETRLNMLIRRVLSPVEMAELDLDVLDALIEGAEMAGGEAARARLLDVVPKGGLDLAALKGEP